jgi:hypothetical protein
MLDFTKKKFIFTACKKIKMRDHIWQKGRYMLLIFKTVHWAFIQRFWPIYIFLFSYFFFFVWKFYILISLFFFYISTPEFEEKREIYREKKYVGEILLIKKEI